MSLYWKDFEIVPGMVLAVDPFQQEIFNNIGKPVVIWWEILSFESRNSDEAYFDYSTGKKYSLEKVIKKKKLQTKLANNELLQLPACSDFMVVHEYHDEVKVYKRCYNLDMLGTLRNIRLVVR